MKRACLVLIVTACGSESPAPPLRLASSYDAVVAARVAPDGGTSSSFLEVFLTFDGIQVSEEGAASGTVGAKGGAGAITFTGSFDRAERKLSIQPFMGALTSTLSEMIDEFGGRADDILPRDGVADEITGYLRTRLGFEIHDGTMLAVARSDRRPSPPEEDKITVREHDTGNVIVEGLAGAMIPSSGVELFRFPLRERTPEVSLAQARDDGSFVAKIPGIREDLFVVRTRLAGIASDARFFRLMR